MTRTRGSPRFPSFGAFEGLLGGVRAGHAGSLDPFATGLLPVCVGRATRLVRFVSPGAKRYTGSRPFRTGHRHRRSDRPARRTSGGLSGYASAIRRALPRIPWRHRTAPSSLLGETRWRPAGVQACPSGRTGPVGPRPACGWTSCIFSTTTERLRRLPARSGPVPIFVRSPGTLASASEAPRIWSVCGAPESGLFEVSDAVRLEQLAGSRRRSGASPRSAGRAAGDAAAADIGRRARPAGSRPPASLTVLATPWRREPGKCRRRMDSAAPWRKRGLLPDLDWATTLALP